MLPAVETIGGIVAARGVEVGERVTSFNGTWLILDRPVEAEQAETDGPFWEKPTSVASCEDFARRFRVLV